MSAVTNIAAYQFASLNDLKSLRDDLSAFCKKQRLKGTILLSTEGINLFVAGESTAVNALVERIRKVPGLESLTPKLSESTHQPFTRMLVRIKKEIIAFGVDGINPGVRTSPKLSAATLKSWLDDGVPVTLLDTRNDYEVKLGTFRGAMTLGIDHFREFPKAVDALPESLKSTPVVMFCTGGIRCEKAGPYMEREGFQEIYQLDGGILKYFEECGGAHYDGECFVFDQRVGVDPALRESESTQCYVCQTPLTPMDQRDPRYVPGTSCPFCFRKPEEAFEDALIRHQSVIDTMADPLPGSTPAENLRPVRIPANFDSRPLIDFLRSAFAHENPDQWAVLCDEGHIVDAKRAPVSPEHLVRAGERYFRRTEADVEPPVNPRIQLLHEDEALVVLCKPAPLPVHPCGRFHRNTLQTFLNAAFHPERPRPAHRLDSNTSGILICARTRHFARLLQPQFEDGSVIKRYLVQVNGHPKDDQFESNLPVSSSPSEAGMRSVGGDADAHLPAITQFRVIRRENDGTTLLEARPITGRTNQIRVHLRALSLPVMGDPAYQCEIPSGIPMTLSPDAPPMRLHAMQITFAHPIDGKLVQFTAPDPAWCPGASGHFA